MDLLRPLRAFDRFQQRHPALAVPIAVVRKFGDDEAGPAAALIAYYAFVSLFPLLLVFTSVLGFVLDDDPGLRERILDTTLAQIPVIGDQLRTQTLTGSGVALVVGAAGTLFAGLGVTLAIQRALHQVYAVPRRERPDVVMSRLRGLAVLVVLGVVQVLSTVASGLAGGGLGGVGAQAAGVAASLALNLLLFAAAFRLLLHPSVRSGELWPGVVAAAVGWTALQALGGVYVRHVVAGATTTYGTFATVLGLIAWLYLGARIVVLAAEVNTVLSRRLWPRSLFGPPIEADRETLTAIAQAGEVIAQERITVAFDRPGGDDAQAASGGAAAGGAADGGDAGDPPASASRR
ncbi:MAG: YihY/virulence factor BrkB family protein [Solirubrobacteraceae bacterium]|nr:YihY/virulence factor BrkB family protein [Solirubrobacteraceae bacterium]